VKKFKFSLDPLLLIRQRKEDEEIRNLSQVVSKRNRLEREREEILLEIRKSGDQVSSGIRSGLDIRNYMEYSEVTRFLNLKAESLEKSVSELEPELEMARFRYNEASREKKILEILRDEEKSKFKKKLKREERRELEEFIQTRSFLESSEGIKNQITSEKGHSGKSARTFRLIQKQDSLDQMPEDFKTLLSIYNQYLRK
jgi:flagellar FliJ protein